MKIKRLAGLALAWMIFANSGMAIAAELNDNTQTISVRTVQTKSEATQDNVATSDKPTETNVKSGLVKENGYYYYYQNGKKQKNTWKTIDGKKYYFKSSGPAASGSTKIKGIYYIFRVNGTLCTANSKTIYTVGTDKYCADSKGKAVSGWIVLKNKVYYADKTGKCAVSETVDGIKFNDKGCAENSNQALAKIEAKKFINKHTKSNMSREKKFRICFRYIIAHNRYRPRWKPDGFPKSGWQYGAAVHMFRTNLTGNCYGIASAVAAVAKELGYQPYVITAKEGHAFVKANGRYYDNMHGAKFGTKTHAKYILQEKFEF